MPEINILVKAKDQVSDTIRNINNRFLGLNDSLLKMGAVAIPVVTGLGAAVGKLAYDAAQAEPIRISFENLSESIDETAESMLDRLRPAAMHTMSDLALMKSTNKLMAMGLAESSEEAAKLTDMAIRLGAAMGVDATTALENFTLMLANQSIPRLDTFGISSGQVRARIEELQAATEGLSREQAFMQAVMEQGEISLGNIGDISDTSAIKMAQFQASMANAKDEIGEALLPSLTKLLDEAIVPLVQALGEDLAPLLAETLPEAIGPAVEGISALASAIEPLMNALMWMVEHKEQISDLVDLARTLSEISMPISWFARMISEREVTLPGGMRPEEFLERGYLTGQQLRELLGLPTSSEPVRIEVYGLPGLEDQLRQLLERAGIRVE